MGDKDRAEPDPSALTGVLQRFSRLARASESPNAMGSVSAVYPDAIQLLEPSGSAQMRGVGLIFVLCATGMAIWLGSRMPSDIADEVRAGVFGVGSVLFYGLELAFFWFFVRPIVVAAWRLDMFAAEDQPTIFDRKHCKVYRLFTPLDGSANKWPTRFKPIKLQAVEYDWDCITAEHRVEVVTSGNTVSRIHRLVMVVRDHTKPGEKQGRLLEEFNVGNSMALGPNSVPMLWEHIRRFMEERGPGVRHGEPLQVFERPKNLWQSMGVVSPFGPKFAWWWQTNRLVTVLALVALPFTLPFSLLWAVCNWISHMTMRKTIWPQIVHERVGQAIHKY